MAFQTDVRIEEPTHHLNKLEFEPLLRLIPLNASLLDVGCGKGTFLAFLRIYRPDVKTVGIDIYQPNINRSVERGLDARFGDVYDIPFKRDTFDVVTCFHLLEHLVDDKGALKNLVTVCKTRVIIIVPKIMPKGEYVPYHVKQFYTIKDLSTLVEGYNATYSPHYQPAKEPEFWLLTVEKKV